MYDIIVIGAGISGATFAFKTSKFAKILLIDSKDKNNFPISTNLFPEHNKPFLEEINDSNNSIFPCIHSKLNYMDRNYDGIIDSKEFGAPFGYICYLENLLKFLHQQIENRGGLINFNERATKVSRNGDKIEITTNKQQTYSGKLLAIATGSHGFDLQRSLGFGTPNVCRWIYTHLYGTKEQLNENMDYNYLFHLNSKISQEGPFFINKGIDRMLAGFMGTESTDAQNISKLNRILNNYKIIQPFVKNLKELSKPIVAKISKHPIKKFSKDRIIVLGEAAGLVTAFFYEGLLGGIASAEIATKVIKSLLENNKNFTQVELNKYDKEINRILLNAYFKTGHSSELLFYNSGFKMKTLWEIYAKFIKTNKIGRKYIWEAFRRHDLENHDNKRDKWTGEQLFKSLSLIEKPIYLPQFLKALLK